MYLVSFFIIVLLFIFTGCSNTNEKDEIKKDLSSEMLIDIIYNSRSDKENHVYPISEILFSDIIDSEDEKLNNISFVGSVSNDNEAYCVLISNISDFDKSRVQEQLENYIIEKSNSLYTNYYEESLVAKESIIRYVDDYIIFVMSNNATELCESIENNILIELL